MAPTTGWNGSAPTPFRIEVSDDVLVDLRARLQFTRWPDSPPDTGWSEGASLAYMRDLVQYWRDGYDWRANEARLNELPQFSVPIDGIPLHFVHARGEGPAPMPLLISHGWPGSVLEFQKIIPRLTHPSRFGGDPADAFTVVAPSLPGFGFSHQPGQQRFGVPEMARTLSTLMTEVLGYRRFAAHGHDWGSFVSSRLGYEYGARLYGIHITLIGLPREGFTVASPTPEEAAYTRQLAHWVREETGYSLIMATKPQTLAFAMTDSPAGLAAWIVEKFWRWSDCNGDIESVFTRDELLTNVMLYWVTGAINSSFSPYFMRHHTGWVLPGPVQGPMGYVEYPKEILTPPRSLAQKLYTDIRRWTVMPRGGHFAAMEDTAGLAGEIQAFFRPLRPA